MIIHANIHSVSDAGEKLRVEAQGQALGSGEFGPYLSIQIDMPITVPARKSYYVGRKIVVEVVPS